MNPEQRVAIRNHSTKLLDAYDKYRARARGDPMATVLIEAIKGLAQTLIDGRTLAEVVMKHQRAATCCAVQQDELDAAVSFISAYSRVDLGKYR